jgi:hypothetical protein
MVTVNLTQAFVVKNIVSVPEKLRSTDSLIKKSSAEIA